MPPATWSAREGTRELREERLPEQGKGQHDQRGDGHGLQRDGAALRLVAFGVREATSTAESMGPMTAKNVVKAVRAVSSM